MSPVKTWLQALRVPFLTASLVPVVLGTAVAWQKIRHIDWFLFFLALLGVACLQSGTNLANDYFDHLSKNDDSNLTPTPVSGGSRVIQEGLLPAATVLKSALVFFGVGSLIGIYLAWHLRSAEILWLGVVGVFCGFFYTAAPLKLGYRGLGEMLVGLCFGPLPVMGAYCVQTQRITPEAFWASVPVGILIALVVFINEFPDHNADKAVGKKTLVVSLGPERAIKVYRASLAVTYIYTAILICMRVFPISTLPVFLTLPLAFRAVRVSKDNLRNVPGLLPANFATIQLHLVFGLLLSAGFLF
ncbi:MAG: 1,4-dihydroxy-2-naphthoate octaprenyltransferase [Candidatus Omnitrophica bacterium]|nr:1,4-dihydroxy-2-naphthoate octaprenyltransferase [Candidatus Omnitrophota bacterium]